MKQKLFYTYILEIEGTAEIFYVGKGSSKNFKRAKSHRSIAKNLKAKEYNRYLYRKIRHLWKNGSDFRHRIVFTSLIEQEVIDKEVSLIALIGRKNLTNLTDGGEGSSGFKFSPEKLQELKDFSNTPERLAHLRKYSKNCARPIKRLDTGEEFESSSDAARKLGLCQANISEAIRENRFAYGTIWRYTDIEDSRPLPVEKRPEDKDVGRKAVRRLDTNEVYPSLVAASKAIGRALSTLSEALNKGSKCAGTKWEFIV